MESKFSRGDLVRIKMPHDKIKYGIITTGNPLQPSLPYSENICYRVRLNYGTYWMYCTYWEGFLKKVRCTKQALRIMAAQSSIAELKRSKERRGSK